MTDEVPDGPEAVLEVSSLGKLSGMELTAEETMELAILVERMARGLDLLRQIPLQDAEPATRFLPE